MLLKSSAILHPYNFFFNSQAISCSAKCYTHFVSKSLVNFIKKNIILIGLFALGFLTYAPSLNNQLLWDDEQFIYNNSYVKEFAVGKIFTTNTLAGAGEISNYYRPLTTLSFAIDHQFWGLNPIGFHLTNTIVHASAGALLFLLLTSLGMSKKPAMVVSAIFLTHPLQTEAVVYANSRGDSLFTFFMLLGLLSFSYFLQKKQLTFKLYNLRWQTSQNTLFFLTVFFFIASLLAKEIAMGSILLYILVCAFLHISKKKTTAPIVLATLTGILLIYGALRTTVLQFKEQINLFAGTAYGDSVIVRLATFCKVLLIYISLIFAPFNLHMERDTDFVLSIFSPYTVAVLVLLTAVVVVSRLEFVKKKTVWIGFGFAWFLGMLLPISGIFPINDVIYEHWLYVPLIGFVITLYGMISFGLFLLKKPWPKMGTYLLLFLIGCYVLLTIKQNYLWGKATRFYPYILQYNETARIHNNLAMAYADEQQLEKAISHYQRAIEINDRYPQTHHNLARTYLALGNTQKALEEFTIAVTMNPDFLVSYPHLVQLHLQQGSVTEAEKYLARLTEEAPNSPLVLQLTQLLEQTKQTE